MNVSEPPSPHAQMSVMELVERTLSTTGELAQKQIELLRAELEGALQEQRTRLIELGIGALLGMLGVVMLLVAAVLALGVATGHAELYSLGVGVACAIASLVLVPVSLRKQRDMLSASRRIATEEIAWAKQQMSETESLTSPTTSNASDVEVNR